MVQRRALHPTLALAMAAALSACAGPSAGLRQSLEESDLQARLAARAHALLGQGLAPFAVAGERFNPDCSGFVEAVYAAEGIRLRRILQAAAPHETSAVAAAWEAAGRWGRRWSDRGTWPAPGDLVFFDDTWDRNGNGRRDDPLTHVGVVEWVDAEGTVTFLHRGGHGVARGHLDLASPERLRAGDGRELNTPLRVRRGAGDDGPFLAGQLFVGFGRIDPSRAPVR